MEINLTAPQTKPVKASRPSVKLIQNEEATPEVQKLFANLEQEKGAVPPTFRALANNPEYMKIFMQKMKVVMAPGKLHGKAKLLIALAVSIVNGSDVCIANHTQSLKSLGVDDEELLEVLAVIDFVSGMNRLNIGLRMVSEK